MGFSRLIKGRSRCGGTWPSFFEASSTSCRRFIDNAETNVAVAARGRAPPSRHCSQSTKIFAVVYKTALGMKFFFQHFAVYLQNACRSEKINGKSCFGCLGSFGSWNLEILAFWNPGILKSWNSDISESQNSGILESWDPEIVKSQKSDILQS